MNSNSLPGDSISKNAAPATDAAPSGKNGGQPQGLPRRALLKGSLLAAASASLWGVGKSRAESTSAILSNHKPNNIIFCVSDGMSTGVLAMAEEFSKLTRGRGTNWIRLAQTPGVTNGLMETASLNSAVTDSAAASSAWSSGHRVNNGAINITPDGKEHQPIGPAFQQEGKKFGIVTTATITHATPAGFAVCQAVRSEENEIAEKYIGLLDVALGGGRTFFDPGQRPDGVDLWERARGLGYDVCMTREDLLNADDAALKLLGTFSNSHLPYVIDRPNSPGWRGKIPTLSEMARAAIARLKQGSNGFLLQIEGARVDHAAHHNDIGALLQEQLDFDDAVGVALDFARERGDTLVIVTSDHGNANPGLNGVGLGYAESSQAFSGVADARESFHSLLVWAKGKLTRPQGLGEAELAARIRESLGFEPAEDEAAALLTCANGDPFSSWSRQLSNFWGLLGQIAGNHNGVGWTGISHTSDPTILSATGPGSEEFSGYLRNDAISTRLRALGNLPASG